MEDIRVVKGCCDCDTNDHFCCACGPHWITKDYSEMVAEFQGPALSQRPFAGLKDLLWQEKKARIAR